MTVFPVSLDAVNGMPAAVFVAAFGDVAEHAPWVAETAAGSRPFASRDAMIAAFAVAIAGAGEDQQRALLLAHPDLAGKAAMAGALTAESKSEQAGAGLDALSAQEFQRFTDMNTRYRKRHGVPFILAVKGATKHDILASFEARVDNPPGEEFRTALEQVKRIVRFRLEDRVRP